MLVVTCWWSRAGGHVLVVTCWWAQRTSRGAGEGAGLRGREAGGEPVCLGHGEELAQRPLLLHYLGDEGVRGMRA